MEALREPSDPRHLELLRRDDLSEDEEIELAHWQAGLEPVRIPYTRRVQLEALQRAYAAIWDAAYDERADYGEPDPPLRLALQALAGEMRQRAEALAHSIGVSCESPTCRRCNWLIAERETRGMKPREKAVWLLQKTDIAARIDVAGDRVPSLSHRGTWHHIATIIEGRTVTYDCDCTAAEHGSPTCWHREVYRFLSEKIGGSGRGLHLA